MSQPEDQAAVGNALRELLRNPKTAAQTRPDQPEAERKRLREERRALMVDHDSQCI